MQQKPRMFFLKCDRILYVIIRRNNVKVCAQDRALRVGETGNCLGQPGYIQAISQA